MANKREGDTIAEVWGEFICMHAKLLLEKDEHSHDAMRRMCTSAKDRGGVYSISHIQSPNGVVVEYTVFVKQEAGHGN